MSNAPDLIIAGDLLEAVHALAARLLRSVVDEDPRVSYRRLGPDRWRASADTGPTGQWVCAEGPTPQGALQALRTMLATQLRASLPPPNPEVP